MPGRQLAELRLSILDAIVAELLGSNTAILFGALIIAAALFRTLAPDESRRVRTMTMLFAAHATLAVVAGALSGVEAEGAIAVHYISVALATLNAVGIGTNVLWIIGVRKLGLPVPPILRDLAGAIAVVIALIILAGRAGINVAGLVATSAVLTAVVGLSLQDTLGNLVAGLTLQSDTTLRVGEWIKIGDVQGLVVEMRWRFTSIETRNGETLIIPNSSLVKDKVMVLGRRRDRPVAWRRWIMFDLDYKIPHGDAIEVVTAAFRNVPLPAGVASDPPVDCVVNDFKGGAVGYAVRYWLTNITADGPVDSEVRRRITAAIERAGMSHAYPLERRLVLDEPAVAQSEKDQHLAERSRAIRRIDLLQVLEAKDQSALAERLDEAPFAPGEVLFRQNAESDALYVIDAGRVSVRLQGPDGRDHEIAQLGPGDVLGEMGVMTGEKRTATAVAIGQVRAYRLPRDAFDSLLRVRPEVAEALARVLAERQSAQAMHKDKIGQDGPAKMSQDERAVLVKIRRFFGLEN